ncbi:MAG: hypothetical protein NXI10_17825 [bacterium]|nr:hypothetical protein [bacterium]
MNWTKLKILIALSFTSFSATAQSEENIEMIYIYAMNPKINHTVRRRTAGSFKDLFKEIDGEKRNKFTGKIEGRLRQKKLIRLFNKLDTCMIIDTDAIDVRVLLEINYENGESKEIYLTDSHSQIIHSDGIDYTYSSRFYKFVLNRLPKSFGSGIKLKKADNYNCDQ